MSDPIAELAGDINCHTSERKHKDKVLMNGGTCYLVKPADFVEIEPAASPRTAAYIDGGNGLLIDSPDHIVTLNRVAYSLFCGEKRLKQKSISRTEFLADYAMGADGRYHAKFYGGTEGLLPAESDVWSDDQRRQHVGSLARLLAEWKLASEVVQTELGRGDIIVMDGSLETGSINESKYAKKIFDEAKEKGVIVCGLAKTSRLVTEAGASLLPRMNTISKKTDYARWYVRIMDTDPKNVTKCVLAVKLHPSSRFAFRLDVLQDQFVEMDEKGISLLLGSIAANAGDITMPGYPYGAIDADKLAQVRDYEIIHYRENLIARLEHDGDWDKLPGYMGVNRPHGILNQVSG